MVNGKKEGSGLLENRQGCSIAECFFRNDMLEGSFTRRTPEGVLVQTECYVNGKREGVVQKFDADGNRTEMVRCSNGGEVSVLHPFSSLEGYWEERSKATNEILSVAKYTADFSAMDGLCFIYEQGRVRRGEWYRGGRMERVVVEFDEKVRTEFGEGGEKCFVGEYRNDVASGFCREGKGCVLEGGVVARVNMYANGEEVRRWKMLVDEVMTEMDEKGVVVYVGEYAENPELFCPRNGKGTVFENGELKCVGVFEGDAMKRKELEFEKGLMREYDEEGKMVYWGGYVKNEKGAFLHDGQGTVYEKGVVAYCCCFEKGELKRKAKEFKDGVMIEYDKKGKKVYEGGFEMKKNEAVRSGRGRTFQWGQVKVEGVYKDGWLKKREQKNSVHMTDARANGYSAVFLVVSLLLAAAAGWCYFKHPSWAPYGLGVCVVVEVAFMVYQYSTMSSACAYYANSITSMLVLLFLFCLALNGANNRVYLILSVVLGVGIVGVVGVIGMKEERGGVLLGIDLAVFIGWCVVMVYRIKSPPLLSYGLLGWWFAIEAVLVGLCCVGYVDGGLKVGILSTELVCLIVCSVILSFMNDWLFYISLSIGLVCLIAGSVEMADDRNTRKSYSILLFVIDVILFVGWCIFTIRTIKSPLLSYGLLGWWFVTAVALVVLCCVGEMNDGLRVVILSTELVCLFICNCILSFVNNLLFGTSLVVGLVCLVLESVFLGREKESKKSYSIILFVIDVILFVGWCVLMVYTIKSPPLLSYGLLGWWFAIGSVLVGLCCGGYVDGGLRVGVVSTELLCLFICTCILSFVNNWLFGISLVLGLVCFIAVSVIMGGKKETKESYSIILLVIDMILFVGWCIFTICTIKSPPLLSYGLLGWWFAIAVTLFVVFCIDIGDNATVVLSVELVRLFICTCILSFVNNMLFGISLVVGLVCFIAVPFVMADDSDSGKCYSIILFVIDAILFVGWCILAICTIKSPPLLSYGLLGWWLAITVTLFVCCCIGEMDDELKVGILITELVCLIICTCILSFVNNWLFGISLVVGLVCFIAVPFVMADDSDSGKCYSIILFVIDAILFVGWCILAICTIKSPPLLSYGLLGWWLAITVTLFVCCCIGEMDDELKVGILITELVCLIICTCILSFVNNWLFVIPLVIGLLYVVVSIAADNCVSSDKVQLAVGAVIGVLIIAMTVSLFWVETYPLLFGSLGGWLLWLIILFSILCCKSSC